MNQNVEFIHEILDDIIFDKYRNPTEPVIRQVEIGNQTMTHLHVYTQYVGNTCGYHSTYNIISFMQLIQNKGLDIYSPFKFWQYCFQFKVLLRSYRELNNLQLIEPWRDKDINDGDFERTYLDVWLQSDYLPKQINIQGKDYQVIFETIYYQYGNMLSDQDELLQLEENINKFRQENSILNIIIGATNHWVVLIAINDLQRLKFYFLDSRNDDYLLFDEQQVDKYVNQVDQYDQITFGSKPMQQYQKDIFYQSVFDIQNVSKLITRFISGEENIHNYITFQALKGFLNPLFEALLITQEQFLQLNIHDIILSKESILKWCEQYKNTMYHYMKHPKIITNYQNQILNKLLFVLKEVQDDQVNHFRESAFNITQAIIDFSNLHENKNLQQKQKHVYFEDSEIYEHSSHILEMKKVYIQDYATKIYSFVIRIKFQENLFHAQGGGQLDDQGFIIVGQDQIKVLNLFNDRQHVEIYVDILHTIEIYEQLTQAFRNNQKIQQIIDKNVRIHNTRYQSAGHLINVAAIQYNNGLQMETTRHYIREKDASIELFMSKPVLDNENDIQTIIEENLNNLFKETDINDTLKIEYLSIKEIIAALTYFPDFVLEKDKIRIGISLLWNTCQTYKLIIRVKYNKSRKKQQLIDNILQIMKCTMRDHENHDVILICTNSKCRQPLRRVCQLCLINHEQDINFDLNFMKDAQGIKNMLDQKIQKQQKFHTELINKRSKFEDIVKNCLQFLENIKQNLNDLIQQQNIQLSESRQLREGLSQFMQLNEIEIRSILNQFKPQQILYDSKKFNEIQLNLNQLFIESGIGSESEIRQLSHSSLYQFNDYVKATFYQQSVVAHTSHIHCFQLMSDQILYGCNDMTLNIWSISQGKQIRSYQNKSIITSCTFSQDNKQCGLGDQYGFIKLFKIYDVGFLPYWQLQMHQDHVIYFIISKDIISCSKDQFIKLTKIETKQVIMSIEYESSQFGHNLDYYEKLELLAIPNQQNIIIFDMKKSTNNIYAQQQAFDQECNQIQFSIDGNQLLSTSFNEQTIKVWTLIHGDIRKILIKKTLYINDNINNISWVFDDQYVLYATNKKIFIINIEDDTIAQEFDISFSALRYLNKQDQTLKHIIVREGRNNLVLYTKDQ